MKLSKARGQAIEHQMRNHLSSDIDGRRQIVTKQNKDPMRRKAKLSKEIARMEDNTVYRLHSHH